MRVTFYGELDPFSGSIAQHMTALARVVAELEVALLFSDVVIVAPGNLLEHSLTLPAFETLAPFVAAGRLTTTTDRSSPGPHGFIDERVELHIEEQGRRAGPVQAERLRCIEDARRRWHAMLPQTWTLSRDVGAQVLGFIERIVGFCEQTHAPSPATRELQVTVDRVLQAGKERPDRGALLAHLAARRDEIPPHELSRLALAVQTAFFAMGAESHASVHEPGRCHLFPGAFARLVERNPTQVDSLALPPYDWMIAPDDVDRRLRRIGLDLPRVLGAGPRALLDVAESPEWRAIKALLDDPESPRDIERALQALFRRYPDFRDALGLVRAILPAPPRPAAMTLPARWQLATQALIGASLARDAVEGGAVLDLRTLRITRGSRSDTLTRSSAHLVTVLAIAGDVGLSLYDIEQLMSDVDRLSVSTEAPLRDERRTPPSRCALSKRIDALKSSVNRAIGPLGLFVELLKGRGRFRLVTRPPATEATLRLAGTIWDLLGVPAPLEAPAGLSMQDAMLWKAFAEVTPHYLSVPALARVLSKPDDERGLKQTVDAVGKLAAKLAAVDGPLRVVRFRRGLYGLLPRLPGEVT